VSRWSRIGNVFRGDRVSREIDEEFEAHIEEAIAHGRDPVEARRAFGSRLRQRDASRDIRILGWLDALRADAVFGWRQLRKNAVTSAAAILSLALAIGACTSAFRLIDALLLRPLPVTAPGELYALSRASSWPDGKPNVFDGWEYPLFQRMVETLKSDAELLAVSYVNRIDLTYGAEPDMEKAYQQYVSGALFESFGLRPALGRLFTAADDRTPGAHPYAVISHDYWIRRFDRDPRAIGRTFRMDGVALEIIGVLRPGFTGTEPGTITDILVPAMMHPAVARRDSTWIRTLARIKPGVPREPLRAQMQATFHAYQEERAAGFTDMTRELRGRFVDQTVLLDPAPAGVSGMQRDYGASLAALAVLVGLVLLIACANVANLMTAQAASRAREMALRVSIGAGRWRLVQLVLVESAWLAGLAAAIGGLFAWWAAPIVVSLINPPDNPARLVLPADWRVLGFGLALTLIVTCLFGLAPALRASAVRPISALKGGADFQARPRLMRVLVGVQVAFCVLVLFVCGLFVSTFDRLSHLPTGFSAERLLTLETIAEPAQPPAFWAQVGEQLRTVPGVETVAWADRALLDDSATNSELSIDGAPAGDVLAFFRAVSPGWTGVMRIPFIDGRDFREGDRSPGVAIVNEAFAKQFFNGANPVGRSFERMYGPRHYRIVGLVRDARYRSLREPILPTAYVPFEATDDNGGPTPLKQGTFIVRTAHADPTLLAAAPRGEVSRARAGFRVSSVRTQLALNQSHSVRERLLATLALFFAAVALALAGVGLYGVLHYTVLQRRREIGVRVALGARALDVARGVTVETFSMGLAGATAGLLLGVASGRYLQALFFDVRATDPIMLALPSLTIVSVAMAAALPAVIRAVRVDPVIALRAD
jgi:predicted permease